MIEDTLLHCQNGIATKREINSIVNVMLDKTRENLIYSNDQAYKYFKESIEFLKLYKDTKASYEKIKMLEEKFMEKNVKADEMLRKADNILEKCKLQQKEKS